MTSTQNVTQIKDHETAGAKLSAQAPMTGWDPVSALNQCLAHAIELRARIKQAHWGAKGDNFYVFHKMADEFTLQLDKQADKLSARIVAMGGAPVWTPSMIVKTSALPEYPSDIVKVSQYVEALIVSYDYTAKPLPALMAKLTKLDDYVTTGVIASFLKVLDEHKGFLAAHSGIAWLEKPKKQYAS